MKESLSMQDIKKVMHTFSQADSWSSVYADFFEKRIRALENLYNCYIDILDQDAQAVENVALTAAQNALFLSSVSGCISLAALQIVKENL